MSKWICTRLLDLYDSSVWPYLLYTYYGAQVYVASISAMISLYMRNAQLDHMLNAQVVSSAL